MLKPWETLSVSRIERRMRLISPAVFCANWDGRPVPATEQHVSEMLDMVPSSEILDIVPELPNPGQRWTVRRKATVIGAVRGGFVRINEVCGTYASQSMNFSPGSAT